LFTLFKKETASEYNFSTQAFGERRELSRRTTGRPTAAGKESNTGSDGNSTGKEDNTMVLPRDSFQMQVQGKVLQSWQQLIKSMEESLDLLEKGLDEASEMRHICTDEWCVATEHVLDELSNDLFSISEPRWASEADSKKLKTLKRKVHDLYGKYKAVSKR